jgi:hypothetical protein
MAGPRVWISAGALTENHRVGWTDGRLKRRNQPGGAFRVLQPHLTGPGVGVRSRGARGVRRAGAPLRAPAGCRRSWRAADARGVVSVLVAGGGGPRPRQNDRAAFHTCALCAGVWISAGAPIHRVGIMDCSKGKRSTWAATGFSGQQHAARPAVLPRLCPRVGTTLRALSSRGARWRPRASRRRGLARAVVGLARRRPRPSSQCWYWALMAEG